MLLGRGGPAVQAGADSEGAPWWQQRTRRGVFLATVPNFTAECFGVLKERAVVTDFPKGRQQGGTKAASRPRPRCQARLQIPNAGHACYLDAPEVFNRELLRFLSHEILPA